MIASQKTLQTPPARARILVYKSCSTHRSDNSEITGITMKERVIIHFTPSNREVCNQLLEKGETGLTPSNDGGEQQGRYGYDVKLRMKQLKERVR